MSLSLDQIVSDFAAAMFEADSKRPVFVTHSGHAYRPGIGPHNEEKAVYGELSLWCCRARISAWSARRDRKLTNRVEMNERWTPFMDAKAGNGIL
jgi:hypothetical protein